MQVVTFNPADLILAQVQVGQIVESGKSELGEPVERRVLQRQFLQLGQPPEGELAHDPDRVAVQVELAQLLVLAEGVALQLADVVLDQRQVLDSGRNIVGHGSQASAVAQHL